VGESDLRILSVLIAAIGGQGGNVLTEWIFSAAELAGYRPMSIALPGLAQRGGATNYYMEIAISQDPRLLDEVVFGHYPVPGAVDVLLGQEYLELARLVQQGYSSRETSILASTHRFYSVTEKMPMYGGVMDSAKLEEMVRAFSGQYVAFDAIGLVRRVGLEEVAANAALLGGLAAAGFLPIGREKYEQAIKLVGVAVEANLKAFEAGFQHVASGEYLQRTTEEFRADHEELIEAKERQLSAKHRRAFRNLVSGAIATLPEPLVPIAVEALARLTDYQSPAYAADYLRQLVEIIELDRSIGGQTRGFAFSQIFAKTLATMMAYHDAVRVAELKTRSLRFDKIRQHIGVQSGEVYSVTDYLKPDAYEIYGLFPEGLVKPVLAVLRALGFREGEGLSRVTWEQRPRTTSVAGYLWLKWLTLMKPFRPRSMRFKHEKELIAEYVANVKEFAPLSYELACLAARTGQMIKGYGEVRRRTIGTTRRFVQNVLRPLVDYEANIDGGNFRLASWLGEKARLMVGADDKGIDRAEKLVAQVLDKARREGYQAALGEVATAKQ
jgi:indolepyruvate ferredoxin oxidoreductase beta subunit